MSLWQRLFARPPIMAAPAAPPDPLEGLSTEEIFDRLLVRIGFDVARPSWGGPLRQLHAHSRKKRLQVLPDFFYTSAFSPASLPDLAWSGRFDDCARFDLEAQLAFLATLNPSSTELAALPYADPAPGESRFHWSNVQFGHADAGLYYSLIRRLRPARIVEVGAGFSTSLALQAIRANGAGSVLCIDPRATPSLARADWPMEIRAELVQETPDEIFLGLDRGDVLFIDSSHISKTGSDVNHLFLKILPRLPPGVLVHIHDICLPFEYPRYWSEDWLCYWNEQYVLAALLANSARYEILVGVYFLSQVRPEALAAFIPQMPGVKSGGGSLWMRSR